LILSNARNSLDTNELHRTIHPDPRRHHTKDAHLGFCKARRDGVRPRLGRREDADSGGQRLSCQGGGSGSSEAPRQRVPQKGEGNGTVPSNHDIVPQLQEGKPEEGRRADSVTISVSSCEMWRAHRRVLDSTVGTQVPTQPPGCSSRHAPGQKLYAALRLWPPPTYEWGPAPGCGRGAGSGPAGSLR